MMIGLKSEYQIEQKCCSACGKRSNNERKSVKRGAAGTQCSGNGGCHIASGTEDGGNTSIAQEQPFFSRIAEMTLISVSVAVLFFLVGIAAKYFLRVDL